MCCQPPIAPSLTRGGAERRTAPVGRGEEPQACRRGRYGGDSLRNGGLALSDTSLSRRHPGSRCLASNPGLSARSGCHRIMPSESTWTARIEAHIAPDALAVIDTAAVRLEQQDLPWQRCSLSVISTRGALWLTSSCIGRKSRDAASSFASHWKMQRPPISTWRAAWRARGSGHAGLDAR